MKIRGSMNNGHSATILIVDDEKQIRDLLTRFLEPEGYCVLTAGNVAQALALLAAQPIDLILLDLHMPGPQNGEDFLFLLRDRGNDIPIIVVSGYVDDEATLDHPECVHAVVKKPVRQEALLTHVRQALA